MKFQVPDMSCGHCRKAIETAVLDTDPKADLTFDMDARIVRIDSALDARHLQATLGAAGYPATAV